MLIDKYLELVYNNNVFAQVREKIFFYKGERTMKKSTRIVSLLLVLLMLVGMMPLALFATGTDAGSGTTEGVEFKYHDGKPVTLPTSNEITAIGATQKVLEDFNVYRSLVATDVGAAVTTGSGRLPNSSLLEVITPTDTSLKYVLGSNGNKYIRLSGYDSSSGTFRMDAFSGYAEGKELAEDFVFSIDVKLEGNAPCAGNLIQACTYIKDNSYATGVDGITIVSLGSDGSIIVSLTGEVVGYANLRLVSTASLDEAVQPGWNKDKTSYVSLDTLSPLTGIQRVDGLYYDFADGTSATLLNGLYTYDIYKTRNNGWYYIEKTPCEYVDGKPMFASVSGNTLSMDGKIEVNYYLNLSVQPESDTYVEFTVNGQVQTFALKNATFVEKQGYKTTVSIPAAEMADTIKAVVKYADGTVLATFADYSAVEYAYDILSSEKEEYVRAHDAVKAMLNYATAAQVQFNQNTANLANSELSPEDKALIEDISVITGKYSESASAGFSGATYVSSTLGLEGTTTLYHFFTLGEGASIDDYDVTVSGGLEVEKTLVGGRMRVAVSGIIAANLNEEYTVTLTKGEETLSVTYSAMKYAELVVTRYADNAEYASLVNVMKALYEYWDAAYDYANPTDVSIYDANYTLLY